MRAPWSLDNVTIPAQGLSHEVGISGAKLFVTVANNIIVGGASTTVEVLPNGSTQNLKIGYGTVMTFPINAEWVLITGTGANVSVRLSSIPMPLTVNVVSVSSISGTVNTDVGQGGQKSGNTTLNFGGTPVDPRDRNWTLGNGDVPSRGWSLGSGDTPSRSWALGSGDVPVIQGETPTAGTYKPVQTDANGNLLRGWSLGATDVPGRGWSLGSGDQPDITANQSKALGTSTLPVYIRPLNSGDTPARSWGLGSNDNPDITVNQANPLGSSTKPVYIRGLNSSDTPKPIGSNGGGFTQDTSNNLQHVPVLQGTSTPIHTKAAQYDSNNYPLHTIGNVLAGGNGGDSVINSISGNPFNTTGYQSIAQTPPAGYKWIVWGIWTGFFIESALTSPSVSFTQWDFGVLSSVNVTNAGTAGATTKPKWQLLQIISGDTVTQAGASDVASILYCGNGPNGWLNGNVLSSVTGYDLLQLHGTDFQGATLNVPLVVTPNMELLFEVYISAISDINEAYLTMLPMGYQEPL